MAGLSSIGAYLARHAVAEGGGVRRAANADEDTLTLAVEAAHRCLDDVEPLTFGGLFFASMTSPFRETPLSSVIATACDLPRDIVTADFAGSTRAGLAALTAAVRAVEGGVRRILVVAADCRRDSGSDGAVAAVVDAKGRLCRFLASAAVAEDFGFQSPAIPNDANRPLRDLAEVVERVINEYGVGPDELAALAASGAPTEVLVRLTELAGLDPEHHLVTAHEREVGALGSPEPLFRLAAALERTQPGERILVVANGQGAEASLFEAGEAAGTDLGLREVVERRTTVDASIDPIGSPIWDRAGEPERDAAVDLAAIARNTRLYGTRCAACGGVQFPESDVCAACGTREGLEPAKLGKRGRTATVDAATNRAVIDLESGGRIELGVTDGSATEMSDGARARITLRRAPLTAPERYVWKARLD